MEHRRWKGEEGGESLLCHTAMAGGEGCCCHTDATAQNSATEASKPQTLYLLGSSSGSSSSSAYKRHILGSYLLSTASVEQGTQVQHCERSFIHARVFTCYSALYLLVDTGVVRPLITSVFLYVLLRGSTASPRVILALLQPQCYEAHKPCFPTREIQILWYSLSLLLLLLSYNCSISLVQLLSACSMRLLLPRRA